MIVVTPAGRDWKLVDVAWKLSQRARLPGARLYDLAADSVRLARRGGLADDVLLPLACAGSWFVNSPAPSTVFRRWALEADRATLLALLSLFEPPSMGPLEPEIADGLARAVDALGAEPFLVEALSKVLALLVPHAIPLMPPLAVRHLLGDEPTPNGQAFATIASWFSEAVEKHWDDLSRFAAGHAEVPLEAAQVLDRMLWFDSDGFKHFPPSPSVDGSPSA